jgi:hypothetical protein
MFTGTTAPVAMHHVGAAPEAHHEIEQRGKEQQRAQASHSRFSSLAFARVVVVAGVRRAPRLTRG